MWFLNDDGQPARLRRQIRAFAGAGAGAVILHPRDGLLVPYGGKSWFDLVRWIVAECAAHHLPVWLYDEDPFPSGNAGGAMVAEHPELEARGMARYVSDTRMRVDNLFCFPLGTLLWAGLIPPEGSKAAPIDLTPEVGIIRRNWDAAPAWDSRWYYPATPLTHCPRAEAHHPEYAIRMPAVAPGWKLAAYVACPIGRDSPWGTLADTLNPAATRYFIERVHERYARCVGEYFGREIQAFFTDEPKPPSAHPWTPALFGDFRKKYGYDLRQRLEHLFGTDEHPQAMLTRLNYREWIANRFNQVWMTPIARWCRHHHLPLIGHISPEDDPVQQASTIGNLMPLQRLFAVPGIDLILPAVGDRKHPMLNVGVVGALSCSQQNARPGVMSETLGCSGEHPESAVAARILAWQTVMGVNTHVIHGAFMSQVGLRRIEAPPDFGPESPLWPGMQDTARALQPFQALTQGAIQVAPVAILWPIRGFQAQGRLWENENCGPRKTLVDLLLACLENQVGIHFVDEKEIQAGHLNDGRIRIGKARYSHLLLPPQTVFAEATWRQLTKWAKKGLTIHTVGEPARWLQTRKKLIPAPKPPWPVHADQELGQWASAHLPTLLAAPTDRSPDLRVTAWGKGSTTIFLAMNLGRRRRNIHAAGQVVLLGAGELVAFKVSSGTLTELHRFDPASVSPRLSEPESRPLTHWHVRWPGESPYATDVPLPTFRMRPLYSHPGPMISLPLSGQSVPISADPVAAWLEYSAHLNLPKDFKHVWLDLEPTAARGQVTVKAGGRRWQVMLNNEDAGIVRLDLAPSLKAGGNRLAFRFERPQPLDGFTVAPRLFVT
jgi:hypothetical protein